MESSSPSAKTEVTSAQRLRTRVAALEQLLEAYESAALEQGRRLQDAIVQLNQRAEQLARSEEQLQQQTNILRSILDSMADGVVVVDKSERLILVNPAATDIIGADVSNLPLKEATQFGVYLPDQITLIPDDQLPLKRAVGGERVNDVELYLKGQNDTGVWISANVRPLLNPGGEVVGAVSVFRDITESKLVRQQMENNSRELARSNAELEQFAYVASHDLQEPLRMVSGFAQLLARRNKGKLGEDADEFIGYMVSAVNRMQQLIDDLLTYSRVGSKPQDFKRVSMEDALRHAMRNLSVMIGERKAKVTHDALPAVPGDELQLIDLFQNLLSNAIKFTPGDQPQVHVSAQPEQRHVTFSIRDYGIGIPSKYQDKVFVIFQRLHAPKDYPGTGIGLAICKKIVERHGGEIWFESQPGKGTTFFFTLPIEGGIR